MSAGRSGEEVRYTRRLLAALFCLIALDQFAPSLLHRLETDRYERAASFRFENADLFGLGPLVSYLRENPLGRQRRVAFLGNSIIFGYALAASEALPAQFQKLEPGERVLNMAVNGSELGSSYLIAENILDSVDTLFVQVVGEGADPMLPALIPVADRDIRRFALPAPDALESRLRSAAGIWRMYALNYRFQAALFGTSTRHYLDLHSGELASRFTAPLDRPAPPQAPLWAVQDEPLLVRSPRAGTSSAGSRRMLSRGALPLLWELGGLVKSHRKHAVFLRIDQPANPEIEADAAGFNAAFAPFAEVVLVSIPMRLKFDGRHMTPAGATAFAQALANHERQRSVVR